MNTTPGNISDDRLLELISNSSTSEQGFRLLMEKYQEKLYWHARRIVQNHDDADDVIQNAFIRVYKNIDSFKGNSKLYTWLYRIVTNESITFANNRKKKPMVQMDNFEKNLPDTQDTGSFYNGSEIQQRLQEAIATLPEKQRIVFNLRYFDEMSYSDLSELLGTSEGALKASFHHAVKKIENFITGVAIS